MRARKIRNATRGGAQNLVFMECIFSPPFFCSSPSVPSCPAFPYSLFTVSYPPFQVSPLSPTLCSQHPSSVPSYPAFPYSLFTPSFHRVPRSPVFAYSLFANKGYSQNVLVQEGMKCTCTQVGMEMGRSPLGPGYARVTWTHFPLPICLYKIVQDEWGKGVEHLSY